MEHLFPANPLHLTVPLGRWLLTDDSECTDHWDWFISPNWEFLYRQFGINHWRRHLRIPGNARTYHQAFLLLEAQPPPNLQRATVQESLHHPTWTLFSTASNFRLHEDMQEDKTVTFDSITVKQPSIQWFHDHLESTPSTDNLFAHIQAGTAICVSDGSWIVACPDASEWISGGGMVPLCIDSYRTPPSWKELSCQTMPIAPPLMKCCCDGSLALNQTGIPINSNRLRSTHTDLISILSNLWSKLPFVLVQEWVKGHQDDLQRPLTVIELLNCWMDHKAKQIVRL